MTNKETKVTEAFNTLREGVKRLIQNPSELEKELKHYGDNYEWNKYSPFNTLLLMFETYNRKNRMFQMARGYRQWQKEYNRKVKKGEKAMYILAPKKVKVTEIDEETGEETVKYVHKGFINVPVFELSQTEGEPLPRTDKNCKYKSLNDLRFKDFVEKVDVPVFVEALTSANGYTDGKKIVVGEHNGELASICTLFHELAHCHLHYDKTGDSVALRGGDCTSLKELEAETVAFMVSSALGITNEYSASYVASWSRHISDLGDEFDSRCIQLLNEALAQIDLFIDCVQS